MTRNILHCDMNNFYASVECMLNPKLKQYPVAVCGSVEERHGIVLAKNYKAKAFKVATGDAVWQAKEKCPDLVVVPPHYEEYLKYSRLAKAIYSEYTNQVEPYGMDECWLDITGTKKLFGNPIDVANEIRERIKFELGLTISVGVSFNKIFAKLGSDYKKPDAVTVFEKDSFREKIWGLPASDLLGVGRATTRVLDNYCIRTIGDLANADYDFIKRTLGKNGVSLWLYANGRDSSIVKDIKFVSPVKSIGHGITTVVDLSNEAEVWRVFLELTQDIGHKLRVHQKVAKGVAVYVRDNTLFTKQWQRVFRAYKKLPDLTGTTIYKVLPDKLIKDVLSLNLEYHHLSLDGSVLGLTTPFSAVEYKVFDYADEESYCVLDGKTILIERDLNADVTQIGRCNFTKSHEAGHQILKMLFPNDYGGSYKRIHFYLSQPPRTKTIDWLEWQANGIASVILMPRDVIMQAMFLLGLGDKISMINKVYATREYEQFSAMADFLGVSKTALSIRLTQLGLVERNYFNNPYDLTNVYYDGGM